MALPFKLVMMIIREPLLHGATNPSVKGPEYNVDQFVRSYSNISIFPSSVRIMWRLEGNQWINSSMRTGGRVAGFCTCLILFFILVGVGEGSGSI